MGGDVGSLTKKLQIAREIFLPEPVKVAERFPFHNRQQSRGQKFWGEYTYFKKAEHSSNQFS